MISRWRDWQIDFGPVSGQPGQQITLTNSPQVAFRGEKGMCSDTGSPPGSGTRIGTILVGNRLQRPLGGGGTLSTFMANVALGNGIRWDTCDKGLLVAITVSFVQACTFDMSVFGRALIEEE